MNALDAVSFLGEVEGYRSHGFQQIEVDCKCNTDAVCRKTQSFFCRLSSLRDVAFNRSVVAVAVLSATVLLGRTVSDRAKAN